MRGVGGADAELGIARTLDDEETGTLLTEAGQILGTLPYMSPEQLRGRHAQLDIRTDVYSLGVILYQVLGGRLPFDVATFSLPEAARVISETEAPPLSRLREELRGDLEIIVHKALEKDPERRYSTASELAADLRHWLADECSIATLPSAVFIRA